MILQNQMAPLRLSQKETFSFLCVLIGLSFLCLALPRFLPIMAAFGAAGFSYAVFRHKKIPPLDLSLAGFISGIIVLGAASALWSPDPSFTLERALKTSGLFLGGYALLQFCRAFAPFEEKKQNRIAVFLAFLFSAANTMLFLEMSSGFAMTNFVQRTFTVGSGRGLAEGFVLNRSIIFLLLLAFPVLLSIKSSTLPHTTKILCALMMLAALLPPLFFTQSQTAQIALVIAALAFCYPVRYKPARIFFAAVVIMLVLAAPWMVTGAYTTFAKPEGVEPRNWFYEASIPHRLEVWNFVGTEIQKHPLIGHGMDSLRFLKADEYMPHMNSYTVLHAHNAVLQIWQEFGLVGTALLIAFFLFLMQRVKEQSGSLQRYYFALLVVVMAVMSIGYGLWQAWQIAMIMAIPALSIAISNSYRKEA
jgi:O-antigen ligase